MDSFDECQPENRFYWKRTKFDSMQQAIEYCRPYRYRYFGKDEAHENHESHRNMRRAKIPYFEPSFIYCHTSQNSTCLGFKNSKPKKYLIFEAQFDSDIDAMKYNGVYRIHKSSNSTYRKNDGVGDTVLKKTIDSWIIRFE